MSQLSLLGEPGEGSGPGPSVRDLDGALLAGATVTEGPDGVTVVLPPVTGWRRAEAVTLLAGLGLVPADGDGPLSVCSHGLRSVLHRLDPEPDAGPGPEPDPAPEPDPTPESGLTAGALRWWFVLAGRVDEHGVRLDLPPGGGRAPVDPGAALAALGLAAAFLPEGAGGPAFRVVGERRLRRVVELMGPAPAGAPPDAWVVDERTA